MSVRRGAEPKAELSVVVLAHNRRELTRACLEALASSQWPVSAEVVLVDNASTDGTASLVEEFRTRVPGLSLRSCSRNLTFSTANNRAAARTSGSVIVFLNNDVCVDATCWREVWARFAADASCGVVGARLRYPATNRVQHAGMHQMLWGYASNYGVGGRVRDPRWTSDQDVFAVTGALMAVRRAWFERVGGFDDGFAWGYEDVDVCQRVRHAGGRVVYVPSVEGVHHESATFPVTSNRRHFGANYRRFRQRWNWWLAPRERAYVEKLRRQGVRRVTVYGMGSAARGLLRTLSRHGVRVEAVTASVTPVDVRTWHGSRVVSREDASRLRVDKLVVGTQAYFGIEGDVRRAAPDGEPLMPEMAA